MKRIITKRIYEEPADQDGYRLLIDRIWPRGVSKKNGKLDEWNKDLAPSTELRKWFDHKAERFEEFTKRYKEELHNKEKELKRINKIAQDKQICLLYGAKDKKHNQAIVLKLVLENLGNKISIVEKSEELESFSKEHRHGLELCFKIRQGISKDVSFDRIKKYTDWFYKTYLTPHFDAEEKYVYPILGMEDPMVKKMLSSRRRLDKLFLGNEKPPEIALSLGEEKLEHHIRFEEHKLFKRILEEASPEQLAQIEEMNNKPNFEENEADIFWN